MSIDNKLTPVHLRIKTAMDGRPNRWLKDRLEERGIVLTDAQVSQRLSGNTDFTGDETIACFDILNIDVRETANN